MGDAPETSLISTCASLAKRALSGAAEIESNFLDTTDETGAPVFQKLRRLTAKLQQLSKDADQLQAGLRTASAIAAKLRTVILAHVSKCDATAAIVVKELMRVGTTTPKDAINVAAVLQYESFLESTMRFLFFATQLLSISVYGRPPLAEAGDQGSSSSKTKSESSGGFFSSLANPFKAATAALRTKPEPFVVPLCHAAMAGNVPQLTSLLNKGANINGRNENGHTALICAIIAGQSDAIQYLLKAGADCSVCDAGGKHRPPLFHAIDAENRAAASLLLKYGAAANQSDGYGQPYFVHLVTGDTAPAWLELLLACGADPCAKDGPGRPVVLLALQKRKKHEDREDVVRLLLRFGAKPDASDADGTPLVHVCVQQKRDELVHELLAAGADPNACDASGVSLLETAVKRNDRALVKTLLERRADPNTRDLYGQHLVVNVLRDNTLSAADREAMAELLLQHGALGNTNDVYGVSALEHAMAPFLEGTPTASVGETELRIPDLLLKQGANSNQRLDKVSGEPTLLTYAIDHAQLALATMALRHGANANLVDKQGRTPLTLAVQKENVDVVVLLLQHGAIVNQPVQNLPLDVATAVGNDEIIQLLKAHGAVSGASRPGQGDEDEEAGLT
ncbi:hypothetical protein SPBR_04134 [Sporothrix brasiliensis 5110]|uniref:Uncharacterized protein n=1 Tax=Sporothrix brasiliensis 5110 TaxID=1398154 RepID=A0A0C2J3R6_9PEZI|nr:uncharacterized protein SPBR_04134 [Sporothrix brasiliensis 5110]KIH93625.1 hypothetical protein SPBR_04134 [Sporothrix brasiliensis 5110]